MNWYVQNLEKFLLLINYILANDKYLQGGEKFSINASESWLGYFLPGFTLFDTKATIPTHFNTLRNLIFLQIGDVPPTYTQLSDILQTYHF